MCGSAVYTCGFVCSFRECWVTRLAKGGGGWVSSWEEYIQTEWTATEGSSVNVYQRSKQKSSSSRPRHWRQTSHTHNRDYLHIYWCICHHQRQKQQRQQQQPKNISDQTPHSGPFSVAALHREHTLLLRYKNKQSCQWSKGVFTLRLWDRQNTLRLENRRRRYRARIFLHSQVFRIFLSDTSFLLSGGVLKRLCKWIC